MIVVDLPDEAATAALAARIAAQVVPGDIIALRGDLGAGKTSFARAFIRACGDAHEEVPSPTFTLVQIYQSDAVAIWHFDLYRLDGAEEAWELGIEEAFASGVSLIEWPERLSLFVTIAKIRIPKQRFDSPEQLAFANVLSYNPWHTTAIHRPLGNQNRARKLIYTQLSELRQAMNHVQHVEPNGAEVFPQ